MGRTLQMEKLSIPGYDRLTRFITLDNALALRTMATQDDVAENKPKDVVCEPVRQGSFAGSVLKHVGRKIIEAQRQSNCSCVADIVNDRVSAEQAHIRESVAGRIEEQRLQKRRAV